MELQHLRIFRESTKKNFSHCHSTDRGRGKVSINRDTKDNYNKLYTLVKLANIASQTSLFES